MDFRAFEAVPGRHIMLLPQSPLYTVVAVSNDVLHAWRKDRSALVGKGFLDLLSTSLQSGQQQQLTALLEQVVQAKTASEIAMPCCLFSERNTSQTHPENIKVTPVLQADGDVENIIVTLTESADLKQAPSTSGALTGIETAYQFFMHAPVIIGFLRGDNYTIELANESLLEVWGRSSDVVGRPLLEAIPELKEQGLMALLDNVKKTGEPFYAYAFPITLVRNGKEEVVYFDFVYEPFYEREGDTVANGVISVGHNVTAQVLAKQKVEEARQEAEKQKRLYETINGSTPDLIYVFDLAYRFTYVNQALLNMWGSTWEKSVGKGLLENGYEPWHAEMHEREIDQVVATKKPIRGEVSFPHATLGKRVYDYIFVPVFNAQGEVEAVAGTTRDITEIKQAEQALRESDERFRNLADESPMFVFIIEADEGGSMSYWNRNWLHYTGQTKEEANGRTWNNFIHPDDLALAMDIFVTAFRKEASYLIPAVRVKRHDGAYRWHAFKGNPRYLPNGHFNGYVGVGFDIHEQKLAEEALRQNEALLQQKVEARTLDLQRTVEELKRSNANLEEFAYAASHDLKEPIRKIHFFSDRIRESRQGQMTPDEERYFERMAGASKRMGTLIDDLLSYSQISIRPRAFEEVNLNGLIDLVLEDLDLEIEDKKAIVKVDKLFTIQGHHRQLQQAFQNLIGNALKYSKPGVVPELQIRCSLVQGQASGLQLSNEEKEKKFYCISITDNGIGFEQADAERIFNVFTRLHGMGEYRGTGIGLSIVRKVIENHNGHIWAQSSPGKGSTFFILLPAA